MSKLHFSHFMDYEDGRMARVNTTGELGIPVNIFIDNAAELSETQKGLCSIDICGVGSDIEIFASEDEYRASSPTMDVISLIPMGTFPADPDDKDFEQSPNIVFTGRVLDVEWNPDAEQNEPNCCILIETLELTFNLYMRYDAPVEKGFIIHGVAWLFGNIELSDDR